MHDIINACFELGGGILLLWNVIGLYKDKQIKGVRIIPTSFFMVWGIWNLYFYPSVDCWWSFAGGIIITTMNTIWVMQMIYYKYIYKRPLTKSDDWDDDMAHIGHA